MLEEVSGLMGINSNVTITENKNTQQSTENVSSLAQSENSIFQQNKHGDFKSTLPNDPIQLREFNFNQNSLFKEIEKKLLISLDNPDDHNLPVQSHSISKKKVKLNFVNQLRRNEELDTKKVLQIINNGKIKSKFSTFRMQKIQGKKNKSRSMPCSIQFDRN